MIKTSEESAIVICFLFLLIYSIICVCVCVHARVSVRVRVHHNMPGEIRGKVTRVSSLLPTMWLRGRKLRSLGLAANASPC